MAAYGLSRMQNQASRGLLFALLAMRMFPHILLAIPFFVLAKTLGMINTYPAMILALVAINQPFTIWLIRAASSSTCRTSFTRPRRSTAANAWQVFARVALPVVAPGLWVTALFSLLLAYNEFLFALVLTGPDTKTLPVAIAEYGGEDINYWSLSAAAAVGIMLPIVAFMMALQRHLVRGLAFGAIKGLMPRTWSGRRRRLGMQQILVAQFRPQRRWDLHCQQLEILLELRRRARAGDDRAPPPDAPAGTAMRAAGSGTARAHRIPRGSPSPAPPPRAVRRHSSRCRGPPGCRNSAAPPTMIEVPRVTHIGSRSSSGACSSSV